MTRPLIFFALAAAVIIYCAWAPRFFQPTFEQRWEPVKFIVPFTRGA